MLDERHEMLPQPATDDNNYTLGRIGQHNVVIACLPAGVTGVTSAARVAEHMRATFTSLRFGLMVGIGSGVPSDQHDIRLGDVVVSKPSDTFGGVIQYDFGKTVQQGRFVKTGSLNKPPDVLLNARSALP
jgi:nucleoside phosphorylase